MEEGTLLVCRKSTLVCGKSKLACRKSVTWLKMTFYNYWGNYWVYKYNYAHWLVFIISKQTDTWIYNLCHVSESQQLSNWQFATLINISILISLEFFSGLLFLNFGDIQSFEGALTNLRLIIFTVFPIKPGTPEKIFGMFIVLRPIRCEMRLQKVTDKPQQESATTWYETTSWSFRLREIFNFPFVSLWKSYFFTTNQH